MEAWLKKITDSIHNQKELKEGVAIVITDGNGQILAQSKTKIANPMFFKTAKGKIQAALEENADIEKFMNAPIISLNFLKTILVLLPKCVIFNKPFPVQGVLKLTYYNEQGEEVHGFAAVSGCLRAENDTKVLRIALEEAGCTSNGSVSYIASRL